MITDQSRLAGLTAYFRDPANPADVNLGPLAPVRVRTTPLAAGHQIDVSGIRLLIEHDDLSPFFRLPAVDGGSEDPATTPLLRVTVMKEMFPGLFADPFRHRVHNIAGHVDLSEGELENGRVMDIDGIPTVVSGAGQCRWTSRKYTWPDVSAIAAAAWELASSRLTPAGNLTYSLGLNLWDASGAALPAVSLADGVDPAVPRAAEALGIADAKAFQITFTATVRHDSALSERHTPVVLEQVGTPLLRAVNLLEPISSIYDICSLVELEAESSHFYLTQAPGPEIPRCITHLDVPAVLVSSPNQRVADGDPYDAASRYEYVEVELTRQVGRLEAKLDGHDLVRELHG
jgi:hypothetical protein